MSDKELRISVIYAKENIGSCRDMDVRCWRAEDTMAAIARVFEAMTKPHAGWDELVISIRKC
ncbi:MAG: hypothetical protein FWD15_02560 [Alphaproteobacteria bacterium]|nr:hypothetical protein [Alphaproteobacteria bacterium]